MVNLPRQGVLRCVTCRWPERTPPCQSGCPMVATEDKINSLLYTAYRWILMLDEPTMQQRMEWIDEVRPFVEKCK